MSENQPDLQSLSLSINIIWVSITAYLVFFMQTGFSFLEAGNIRFKNIQNVLVKNLLSVTLGTILYWLLGFAFSFGSNNSDFIGSTYFAADKIEENNLFSFWLFHWAFACCCSTIVNATTAERINIFPFCVLTSFITGWIYPVAVHWNWGNGFLHKWGFNDFAGGGNVHLMAGSIGLVVTLTLGGRKGRFERKTEDEFIPNNIGYIVLGTLILWLGWYGFNCGSTLDATGIYSTLIGKIGMNTSISAGCCALVTFFLTYVENKNTSNKFNIPEFCNGLLAGLVSITSSCHAIEPWAAFIIGFIGGFIYFYFRKLIYRLKIDDPLSVLSIHGCCGFFALIANSFFHIENGIFYNKNGGEFLGKQIVGAIVILVWGVFWTIFIILPFKITKTLRIADNIEEVGNDLMNHGGYAFLLDLDKIRGVEDFENPLKMTILNEMTKRKNEELEMEKIEKPNQLE